MTLLTKIISRLKYLLLALLLAPFFAWCFVYAVDDLMRKVMEPAFNQKTYIDLWTNVNTVWKNVFEGSIGGGPSIIVKITRFLLTLVVALSITMILYNSMTYIIQTWQWKEGKSLVKHVVYIVIWILISLFSITIMTILQSVSTTLDKETEIDWNRDDDGNIVYPEGRKWQNIINLFK